MKDKQEAIVDTLERIAETKRDRVAMKSDDAEVPVAMWRKHMISTFPRDLDDAGEIQALCHLADCLEQVGLRFWKRRVWGEWQMVTKSRTHRVLNEVGGRMNKTSWRDKYQGWHARWKVCLKQDYEIGLEILEKAAEATWWEWTGGSVLFYWRWPREYRLKAKHGLAVAFVGDKPTTLSKQKKEKDEDVRCRIQKKVEKVLKRRYLGYGAI